MIIKLYKPTNCVFNTYMTSAELPDATLSVITVSLLTLLKHKPFPGSYFYITLFRLSVAHALLVKLAYKGENIAKSLKTG